MGDELLCPDPCHVFPENTKQLPLDMTAGMLRPDRRQRPQCRDPRQSGTAILQSLRAHIVLIVVSMPKGLKSIIAFRIKMQPLGHPTRTDGNQHGDIKVVRMLLKRPIGKELRCHFVTCPGQDLPSKHTLTDLAQERVGGKRPARAAAPDDRAWPCLRSIGSLSGGFHIRTHLVPHSVACFDRRGVLDDESAISIQGSNCLPSDASGQRTVT